MRTILTMKHGSHLYGTATPKSDLDIKEVFIPSAREIILGRVKPVISRQQKEHGPNGFTRKNGPDDVDVEAYSLDKFIKLFCEGQTVAIDMLFATPTLPENQYDGVWRELWENRERLLSKQCAPFLGYVRKQAAKYGIKGSRVAAARAIVEVLDRIIAAGGIHHKLGDFASPLELFVAKHHEHSEFVDVEIVSQGKTIRHVSVCQKKAPFTVTVKEAHAIYKRLLDEYGERARQAEANEGVDWKALSHAVRVGTQSLEYLNRGFVTFPRPDAAHLLKIKRGELPYAVVSAEVEALLEDVEKAAETSSLPAEPDRQWYDDFLLDVYKAEVIASKGAI
jgi:predicted nucleotidyltransferase